MTLEKFERFFRFDFFRLINRYSRLDRSLFHRRARHAWPRPRGRSGCVTTPATSKIGLREQMHAGMAPRTQVCRRKQFCSGTARLPLAGFFHFADFALDHVAFEHAEVRDEEDSIQDGRSRGKKRGPAILRRAFQILFPWRPVRAWSRIAGAPHVPRKPGTERQPSSSRCSPSA